MDRKFKTIETGVDGLDAILNGGIPEKNQVLIAGGPGTGKSLLSFEVIYHCAKRGIPSAFIALDERPSDVVKNIKSTFTQMTDIDDLIRKKMLVIDGDDSATKISTNTESETGYSLGTLVSEIEGIINSIDAEIAVVDSISFLKLMLGKGILYNKSVSSLVSNLRRLDITTLLTLDTPYYTEKKMKFGQEMLLFDGLIVLYHMDNLKEKENLDDMALEVIKMRGHSHLRKFSHYNITESGIKVK